MHFLIGFMSVLRQNKLTTPNTGLAKSGLTSFEETFVLGSTVVLRMNFSANFPPFAKPETVSRNHTTRQKWHI